MRIVNDCTYSFIYFNVFTGLFSILFRGHEVVRYGVKQTDSAGCIVFVCDLCCNNNTSSYHLISKLLSNCFELWDKSEVGIQFLVWRHRSSSTCQSNRIPSKTISTQTKMTFLEKQKRRSRQLICYRFACQVHRDDRVNKHFSHP